MPQPGQTTPACVCVCVSGVCEICLHFYKHRRVIDARQVDALATPPTARQTPLTHTDNRKTVNRQTHTHTQTQTHTQNRAHT